MAHGGSMASARQKRISVGEITAHGGMAAKRGISNNGNRYQRGKKKIVAANGKIKLASKLNRGGVAAALKTSENENGENGESGSVIEK
jgi:hypothetical protein